MTENIKPIFVAHRIDEYDLIAWRGRLERVKFCLRTNKIEGDIQKEWSAGEDLKGSTSGGWCRITHQQKHATGAFTFAYRQSDECMTPYFKGSPKEVVDLYEEVFDDLILDTSSFDGLQKDEAINVLEKHFQTLLMDLANTLVSNSKQEGMEELLMGRIRLLSGAPFDLPKMEAKFQNNWINLVSEQGRQMLQSMLKPIVSVSLSRSSRTLKFAPYKSETRDWVDPGPVSKMHSFNRFFGNHREDQQDD